MTKVTSDDERLLATLADGTLEFSTLNTKIDLEESQLRDRVSQLIDSGLVIEESDEAFGLTRSGKRILASFHGKEEIDRMDLGAEVEQALEAADLRPDRMAAIGSSYLFLKYWSDATAAEIADAIYSEHPAGFHSPVSWWKDCVRDNLARFQTVSPPKSDIYWRFTGTTDEGHTNDGRHTAENYGSVRHAIEHLSCSDDGKRAVRETFFHLYFFGPCPDSELVQSINSDSPDGYDSVNEWWENCLADAFEELPHIERPGDGYTWEYNINPVS